MRCEVRSYSSAKASSWPRDESAISSARWSASVSRPREAPARGADREDFPSEAGGTDAAFTRSTLSRSLALAQEPGGNTLLILEIVVMGASLTVAWDDRALPLQMDSSPPARRIGDARCLL